MATNRVLVTCPPMLGMFDAFVAPALELGLELVPAEVTQTLSEAELIELLPQFDGWIIGDDPASQQVFKAGQSGSLKAAVKWGIGVDNVDFKACEALGIPIINTPGMFGGEVADVAVGPEDAPRQNEVQCVLLYQAALHELQRRSAHTTIVKDKALLIAE